MNIVSRVVCTILPWHKEEAIQSIPDVAAEAEKLQADIKHARIAIEKIADTDAELVIAHIRRNRWF